MMPTWMFWAFMVINVVLVFNIAKSAWRVHRDAAIAAYYMQVFGHIAQRGVERRGDEGSKMTAHIQKLVDLRGASDEAFLEEAKAACASAAALALQLKADGAEFYMHVEQAPLIVLRGKVLSAEQVARLPLDPPQG